MKRKVTRAGVIASVATLIVTLFAAEGSGANAQDPLVAAPIELPVDGSADGSADVSADLPSDIRIVAGASETGTATAGEAPRLQVRFVASEVVQPLPERIEPAPSDAGSLPDLVAATPSGGELGRELMCLAQAVYFESRGEPLAGQLAVAEVIINRSQSSQFPDDYCSVVTERSQFSFVKRGRIPAPRTGSVAWQKAKKIARIAHQNLWESPAADALYFHAQYVRPRWASRKVAAATIDSHIFYR